MSNSETRVAPKFRQRSVVALWLVAAFVLAGCGQSAGTGAKSRLAAEAQAGVAADDPYAASVARDILAAKASAADAAVALALTMTVTQGAAASLGGGGICAVFDGPTGAAETLEFLPRRAAAGGPVAVPGLVRGLAALHARYGRLPWARLVEPAEDAARVGRPVSRTLARNIAAVVPTQAGAGLRRVFARLDGRPIAEGDGLAQVELSSSLGVIKARGGGDLYNGFLARQYVDAAGRAGGGITMTDMRDYVPVWREAAKVKLGTYTVATAPLPVNGGLIAAQMWAMLADGDRYAKATADEIPHLLAELSLRAYDDVGNVEGGSRQISSFRAHALMQNYDPDAHVGRVGAGGDAVTPAPYLGADGASSFVVADNDGSAVACILTMGRTFGIGWWDPVTGIIPAVAADAEAFAAYLGPMLVIQNAPDQIVFAAAATGRIGAPAAMVQTGIAVVAGKRSIVEALEAPRLLHAGRPDRVLVEPGHKGGAALARRGHALAEFGPIGFVNALSCPKGLGRASGGCFFASDYRGSGLQLAP